MRLGQIARVLALTIAVATSPIAAPSAFAQPAFELPGLSQQSQRYLDGLTRRYPGGATPQQRTAAEQRAAQAEGRRDWNAAIEAWEQRLGMPDAKPEQWMALARAALARTPADTARALNAAQQAFNMVPAGPPEIPSLQVMADALRRMERWPQVVTVLEAIVERAPDDAAARSQLADARRQGGMLLRRVRTEAETDPARACLSFTSAPARRRDWQPEDWVRADPPIPGLAVTREEDELCVLGLPWGRTTRLTIRAGMPGEDGVNVRADLPITVNMPDRQARIAFDARSFILPRGGPRRIAVGTINMEELEVRIIRIAERSLISANRYGGGFRLGEEIASYEADDLTDSRGRLVWEGRTTVPAFQRNRMQRSVVTLPDIVVNGPPGAYVLVVRAPDTGERRGDRLSSGLPLLVTDIGLTAWRSGEGLAVQARSLGAATPRAGVRVALMARSNEILSEAETGADGLARFPGALLRGEGAVAPVAVHAVAGDDLVTLDLEATAFDLSDRGVTGRAYPGAVDAFTWLDRGIYRPGETIRFSALLRDATGRPLERDIPVRLRLKRPNGQVAEEAVPERGPDGVVLWSPRLSAGAPVGGWSIETYTDPNRPPIATQALQVDAFVPERLEVKIGDAPGPLVAGTPLNLPVEARFLYGAPGAGLTGEAELRLSVDPEPFEQWRGWRFGNAEDPFDGGLETFQVGETDAQGRGTLTLNLPRVPDATRPLRARVDLSMSEPGGRATKANTSLQVRGISDYVALRPGFGEGSVNDNGEAAVDIAIVSPTGEARAGRVQVRLVRERPTWRMTTQYGSVRYETVWRDEVVETQDVEVAPGRPGRFARNLGFGRYRIVATQAGGLGTASIRVRSGWVGSESPDVPDKVDVSADRRAYSAGETARIRVAAPFAGRASVAVLTDRLLSVRDVEVPAGGTTVDVAADPAWGPGAWIAVTVFKPGEAADAATTGPRRALGLAWVALDPAARRLDVAIEGDTLVRPRGTVNVPVRVSGANGAAHLTLAAVDEGILRITRFQNPDPLTHFTGRRALGTDIRDDYGRLIAPPEGDAATLRQGGDDDLDTSGVQPPQRIVALFSGVIAVGPDGRANVPLEIPEFNGEVRLMAVAWSGERVGSAARAMTVRDPIVAEALLPRFLAPGDEARLPVLLHNLDQPSGKVSATVTVEGPLAVTDGNVVVDLNQGQRTLGAAGLRATGAGEGVVRLAISGPGGYSATQESRITIRSPRPAGREVVLSSIPAGQTARIAPNLQAYYAGTVTVRATWGQPVRYDPAALMRAAVDFPFACSEQASSRIMALSAFPYEEERDARLDNYIRQLLDKQRFDGSLGLWSQTGDADRFVTSYGAEALLRARAAGATVPEGPMNALLQSIRDGVEESGEEPYDRAVQAYRLHVLALAGRPNQGAARRLYENLNDLPTPLSKAQLGAALARMGDRDRAEAAFTAALATPPRRPWYQDYGSAVRDNLAVALLLKESGLLPNRLAEIVGRLPGPEFNPNTASTQEAAWAVATAAALGRDGRPARVSVGGSTIPPAPVVSQRINPPVDARNLGEVPLPQAVSVIGLPVQPAPAAAEGMRISRRFLTPQGENVNLDTLRQNQVFIVALEARSTTNETHRAMIQQGLPAGWEIVGRFGEGDVPAAPFLGTLSEADAFPALDDRFAAAVTLTPQSPVARYAVRVRAVTAGRFELPGAEVRDMYRPTVFARQNTGRITIAPVP